MQLLDVCYPDSPASNCWNHWASRPLKVVFFTCTELTPWVCSSCSNFALSRVRTQESLEYTSVLISIALGRKRILQCRAYGEIPFSIWGQVSNLFVNHFQMTQRTDRKCLDMFQHHFYKPALIYIGQHIPDFWRALGSWDPWTTYANWQLRSSGIPGLLGWSST